MPVFTNALKKESEFIYLGLELLRAYRVDLDSGKSVTPEDLRMAVFGMQIALEKIHLAKIESILYPALVKSEHWSDLEPEKHLCISRILEMGKTLCKYLLEVRMGIDEFEYNLLQRGLVSWHLGEFIDYLMLYLKNEKEILFRLAEEQLNSSDQKELLDISRIFEATQGQVNLQGPKLIFDYLRASKEICAA